jgi:hypothetical protein
VVEVVVVRGSVVEVVGAGLVVVISGGFAEDVHPARTTSKREVSDRRMWGIV